MKIENILVPVDFSQCSKNALKVAIGVAKEFGAKIHMVNAVHLHTAHPDMVGGGLIESIMSDYEKQIKDSFEKLETEVIELNDVPHDADRFISYLTDAIYTESERKNIDLIVMGTRAEHSTLEHLIGTRTTDIISFSRVPVLVIPEKINTFRPKRIGFATDLNEVRNFIKLRIVKELALKYGAEVMIFTILDEPEKMTKLQHERIEQLCAEFKEVKNCSARTVQSDSVTKGILEFSKTHQLDMLAMVPRERSFFERLFKRSVTKNIAIDAHIPLLSFHE